MPRAAWHLKTAGVRCAHEERQLAFSHNLAALEAAFASASFVEISHSTLTVHG
jgi:hypothetical protein